jgi:cell division protein FtsB
VKGLGFVLAVLIVLLQYPVWLGKGSWLQVWEFGRELATQQEINERLKTRNATLDAEVRDLKQGYEAIEERARAQLGMVRQDEVFFYILGDDEQKAPGTNSPEGKGFLK